MKFIADVNIPQLLIKQLVNLGYDASLRNPKLVNLTFLSFIILKYRIGR